MSLFSGNPDLGSGNVEGMDPEYEKLRQTVESDPDDFEAWEKLVRATEQLDGGGLNRNSSPHAINAVRDVFDRFLAKFPLLFGYWKKYADLEFSIAGTEAADMVYERGVASIANSVDLWTNYCAFKVDTSHDTDIIRELFERGASLVGLDFLAHPFWDKYIEFEDRTEAPDRIFAILERVVHIPMHQYARYFERFRQMAQTRPLSEVLPEDMLEQFRTEVLMEPPPPVQAGQQQFKMDRGELEIEREIRLKADKLHLEIFHRTQTETTKRWQYESEIKRPYFHVTELDESQMVNWRKYLDFEESEGEDIRIIFLYERCLVTCAFYDEFWIRYVRWLANLDNREEDLRIVFQRACSIFVPISRTHIRHLYSLFEEKEGRIDVAKEILEGVLYKIPGNLETVQYLAGLERRQNGLDAALSVFQSYANNMDFDANTRGQFCSETARLTYRHQGAEAARQIFQKNALWYLDSKFFWINYVRFELDRPVDPENPKEQHLRVKQVISDIRRKARIPLSTIKDLTHLYMEYLLEQAPVDEKQGAIAKEFLWLDKEIYGPFSVQSLNKMRLAEDGKESSTDQRRLMENGHPGVAVDEAAIRRGENPYTKYYLAQGEQASTNGQPMRFS